MVVPVKNIIKGTKNNDNTLIGGTGVDYIYAYEGDDYLEGGDGNDVLYGGAGVDALYGGEGDDQLSGDAGADYMEGGNGNDTYYVDDAGDEVVENAGEGNDTVNTSISYNLVANVEVLRLIGTDNIFGKGNELNNTIIGNSGNNNIYGGAGNDNLNGGLGDDIIGGGAGDDIMNGGDGVDLLTYKVGSTGGVTVDLAVTGPQNTGGAGIDRISGFENLEGTDFADMLYGTAGNNKIGGLGGGDYIRGRAGDDDVTGGLGADTFRFEAAGAANGVDRLRGFVVGEDKLEFSSSEYDSSATLTYGDVAVGAGAQFVFNDTTDILKYDADGAGGADAITIASLNKTGTLALSDFIFVA